MIVAIPDSIEPKERRHLLKVLPLIYALDKFKLKSEAAAFLGITPRAMSKYISKFPELEKYRDTKKRPPGYYRMLKRYPDA